MRRATTRIRSWTVLALIAISAAGFLSLRARLTSQPTPPIPLTKAAGGAGDHALLSVSSLPGAHLQPRAPSAAVRARLERSYGKLPLTFIANRGQLDRRVAYYIPGRDKSLYFTPGGVTFALAGKRDERATTRGRRRRGAGPRDQRRPVVMPASFTVGARLSNPNPKSEIRNPKSEERWALKLEFVEARPDARPVGREASPTVVSYFKGPQSQWRTGIQTCSSVVYDELWPGIDLVYAGTYERLKYTFEVKPGADPSQIRLAYRGAGSLQLTPEGGLSVSTPAGGFTDDAPYAYQEIDGKRVPVEARYILDEPAPSTLNAQRSTLPVRGYHFHLGAYDHSRPLMLDPVVVMYGGFFGGNGDDIAYAIAADSAGNAYITGSTTSDSGFPVKAGPQSSFSGHDDAFVAKLNPTGTALVYAGYLGGNQDDDAFSIAVDGAGNAYVVGDTSSSETSFPVTVGPILKYKSGPTKGFIAKVSADGTKLLYCGYLGGSSDDHASGVAVDAAGNAYVAGYTSSSDFPVKVGPSTKFSGGPFDVFVARVNAGGTGFDWAGFIGGSGDDETGSLYNGSASVGNPIAVDKDGNVYVTGSTTSDESSFPVKGGPFLTYNGKGNLGWGDAFVAKVKSDGTGLVYAGYLGGGSDDRGQGIAVDGAGNAYVTGITYSPSFPVKGGPGLSFQGVRDGFVSKVAPDGSGLVYSGFIGGGQSAAGTATTPSKGSAAAVELNSIAVNSAGNVFVVGRDSAYETGSTVGLGGTLPLFRGPGLRRDLESGDVYDILVGELRSDGKGYLYLGIIGTQEYLHGNGVAVDAAGNAYLTGGSTGGIAPTVFPAQPSGSSLTGTANHGGNDVVVAKIVAQDLVALSLSSATAAPGTKVTGTVTLDVPAPPQGELIRITSDNRALATPDSDTVTIPAGKQTATFTITTAASANTSATITAYDDTSPSKPQTLTVK